MGMVDQTEGSGWGWGGTGICRDPEMAFASTLYVQDEPLED